MLLIRDACNCKPGNVKPIVEKMLTMAKLSEKAGLGEVRVLTAYVAVGLP